MCASVGEGQLHPYYTLRLGSMVQCLKFIQIRSVLYLLMGGSSGEMWLVSIATKRPVWTKITHGGGALIHMEEVADGTVITFGKDQFLHVWRVSEEGAEAIQSIQQTQFTFCNFSTLLVSEGNCLLCMPTSEYSNTRVIKIHNEFTSCSEETILEAGGKAKECTAIKMVDRNTDKHGYMDIIVVAAYLEDAITIWSLANRSVLFSVDTLLSDKICSMDFDAVRMMGVLGGLEGAIGVFRVKRREGETEDILLHDVIDMKVNCSAGFIRVRKDRKLMICGTSSGVVHAVSWRTLKLLAQLKYHDDSIFQVDYGVEGEDNVIAVCGKDKRVSLWKLY